MNVAFYINQINREEETVEIFNKLNEDLEAGIIDNGSIFYKEVGANPIQPKFGMFNSTDIWYYTGLLIATSMETFLDAIKAINKYNLVYLFSSKSNYDIFSLIGISKTTKMLTRTEEDQRELYRLTGVKPILLSSVSPSSILEAVK